MNKKIIIELLLFYLLLVFLLPNSSLDYDTYCWKEWALYINRNGIGNAYYSGANYPPLIMYFLSIYDFIQGSDKKIVENIHYFKMLPLLFDFLPIVLLICFKKTYELNKGYYFFLIFNIAYLYNSMFWGQVDSIHTNLVLTAIFLCFNFPVLSMVVFILALNMKLQTIIFLPIYLICLITYIKSIKDLAKCIALGIFAQLIILIPFFMANTIPQLLSVVTNSASYFPVVSLNAFNFWYIIFEGDLRNVSDEFTFLGLTYKKIGLFLFCIFSAICLFPLVIKSIRIKISNNYTSNYQELLFLSTGLIALVFFFFNTEMHERYSHPALIFMFFYGLYKRNFSLYILVSIAYFLNIEKVLRYFNWPYHTFIFENRTIACLFLITIVIGIINIYKNYIIKEDVIYLKNKLLKK
jgi:Gpi18-like mannosyltransferase